jgi:hypothetical protein
VRASTESMSDISEDYIFLYNLGQFPEDIVYNDGTWNLKNNADHGWHPVGRV